VKSRFLEAAEADLIAAIQYYNSASETLGDRLVAEVSAAIRLIEEFPEAGPVLGGSIRGKGLSRFPHTLLYAIEEREIVILAVAHQRQDFRAWLEIVRARREGA
jgi:plasmid stabilization system protein ParE